MQLIASSLILAFCGIVYELTLAQTMSVLLGNSYLQFGLTIGLFMAGLGAGSLLPGQDAPRVQLVRLQTTLCLLAPVGFILLWLGALLLPPLALWLPCCALIFSIGFLSGRELPLLMDLAGDRGAYAVLAADYFGMLLAAVAFPYLLLPMAGMLGSLCAAALLNALSIQLLIPGLHPRQRLIFSALPIALMMLILWEEPLWQWFSRQYTSGLL